MAQREKISDLIKAALGPGFALMTLLAIAGYAVLGPTGILAWGDYQAQLEVRGVELAKLRTERDALKNRVQLLDPKGADPDLIGELLRKKVNVIHPDEIIVPLK
ncbi:MAG: cell division protein FtsB [Parasphingorhabdus sp.]|jgi:cell division protein FtsB|uniref:FtsB family cell division protein n=1 Tax=Parasphingorhabdus sp. TaxID=2709688 RepID=UPI002B267B51|nr:septum formation initiator family protein [Parasphingorhabdus sp.]|tara:strand:+ start:709 stop:1020 length:312 start_codon:yes stop_codon:yes gene_type:complete